MRKLTEQFSEWFDGQFLCSRDMASPLLLSENKTMKGKYLRIKRVCLFVIQNPKMDEESIRKEIAMNFFVSMRCSLDYLNYSKIVLEKFKESF